MMQDHDSLLGRRANEGAEVTGAARLWLCSEGRRRLRVTQASLQRQWGGKPGLGSEVRMQTQDRCGCFVMRGWGCSARRRGRSKRRPMRVLISGIDCN